MVEFLDCRHRLLTDLVQERCESYLRGIGGQSSHNFFEHLPAVFVALELVEAGAGGSQQDDVPGWATACACGWRFPASRRARLRRPLICDSIFAAAAPMV